MQITRPQDNFSGVSGWPERLNRLVRQVRSQWLGGRLRRMSLEKKLALAAKRRVGRHMLRMLAADRSEEVRMAVIRRGDLPAMWRMAMGRGNSINIARAWAKAPVLNDQEIDILINRWAEDAGVGRLLAGREGLGLGVLLRLAERAIDGRVIRRIVRNPVVKTMAGKEILVTILKRWPTLPANEALSNVLPSLLETARMQLSQDELKSLLPGVLRRSPLASFQVISKWPAELIASIDRAVFLEWLTNQDVAVRQELASTLQEMTRRQRMTTAILKEMPLGKAR